MSPDEFRVRAPTRHELAAAAEVLVAEDLKTVGEAILGHDFLEYAWNRGGFDLAKDAWILVGAEEAVMGYAHVIAEGPETVESLVTVHPDHHSAELRTALFDRTEQRAQERLADTGGRFRQSISADDRDAARLLADRGMQVVRHFWHMQLDDARSVMPAPSPAGIEIRPIEVAQDLPTVHTILMTSFADHFGHHDMPFEQWQQEEVHTPSFDPALWFVASDGREPIGALTAASFGDRGWVSELGVLPSHRGRGVGAALLRQCFGAFADRGVRRVLLNVDAENPTGATALYERVGMRVLRRWDLWERAMTPRDDAAL